MKKFLKLSYVISLVSLTSLSAVSCRSDIIRDRNKIALSLFESSLKALPYILQESDNKSNQMLISENEFKDLVYRSFETYYYRGSVEDNDLIFKYYDDKGLEVKAWPNNIILNLDQSIDNERSTQLFRFQVIANASSKHYEFQTNIIEAKIYAKEKIDLNALGDDIYYEAYDIAQLDTEQLYNYFYETNSSLIFSKRHVEISKDSDRVIIRALDSSDRYKNQLVLYFKTNN